VTATAEIPRLRRVPRQARSRERLQRVLDAADGLLEREGAASLTTTRVAEEAGVSVGSLYQYLPDKDALVEALANRYLAEFEALMEQVAERAERESWDDPVGVLVDTFADHYRERPGYRALWFGRHLSPELREADRRNKVALAEGVHRILLGGGLVTGADGLWTACRAAVLCADALLVEAFQNDANGEPALLDEAKRILRTYLADVVGRYAPTRGSKR
jgi:AcrR family transcriptional regulator